MRSKINQIFIAFWNRFFIRFWLALVEKWRQVDTKIDPKSICNSKSDVLKKLRFSKRKIVLLIVLEVKVGTKNQSKIDQKIDASWDRFWGGFWRILGAKMEPSWHRNRRKMKANFESPILHKTLFIRKRTIIFGFRGFAKSMESGSEKLFQIEA